MYIYINNTELDYFALSCYSRLYTNYTTLYLVTQPKMTFETKSFIALIHLLSAISQKSGILKTLIFSH